MSLRHIKQNKSDDCEQKLAHVELRARFFIAATTDTHACILQIDLQ